MGDPAYGGTFKIPADKPDEQLVNCLRDFPRQALHARCLSFRHPQSEDNIEFEVPLPEDMTELLSLLEQNENG